MATKTQQQQQIYTEMSLVKKFFGFIFPKKSPYENILQYIIRQLYIPDSNGKPSLTVTILIYTMILILLVTYVEIKNALVITIIKDNTGNIIQQPTGFSALYLTLIISLSVIITTFYRQRQNKFGSSEEGEKLDTTLIQQIIDIAKNLIIKKVK